MKKNNEGNPYMALHRADRQQAAIEIVQRVHDPMFLPDLPKQNKKREADFGVRLKNWLKKHPLKVSSSLEIKHSRGKDYLNYHEVAQEQLAYASLVGSDAGVLIRVEGHNGEPDYIFMRKSPAYFVIQYPDFACIIRAAVFKEEKKKGAASLTAERAKEIAEIII